MSMTKRTLKSNDSLAIAELERRIASNGEVGASEIEKAIDHISGETLFLYGSKMVEQYGVSPEVIASRNFVIMTVVGEHPGDKVLLLTSDRAKTEKALVDIVGRRISDGFIEDKTKLKVISDAIERLKQYPELPKKSPDYMRGILDGLRLSMLFERTNIPFPNFLELTMLFYFNPMPPEEEYLEKTPMRYLDTCIAYYVSILITGLHRSGMVVIRRMLEDYPIPGTLYDILKQNLPDDEDDFVEAMQIIDESVTDMPKAALHAFRFLQGRKANHIIWPNAEFHIYPVADGVEITPQ